MKKKTQPSPEEVETIQAAAEAPYRIIDRRGNVILEDKLAPSRSVLCMDSPYGSQEHIDFRDLDKIPSEPEDAFKTARSWSEKCLMMQTLIGLKLGFYNSGFRLESAESKDGDLGDKTKAWLKKDFKKNARRIGALVRDSWKDWITTDCAIHFWRERAGKIIPRVLVWPAEKVKYSDSFGIEKLQVKTDWKMDDLKGPKFTGDAAGLRGKADRLTQEAIKRYATNGYVELSEDKGEYFRVLKTARDGWGLGIPRMSSVFRSMAQEESMQVADQLWAFLSRAVTRHFKIGHEIRNGPRAGMGTWFWDPDRSEAIREFFEGRVGVLDFTSNFDVDIQFPYPDGERFTHKKYESIIIRLALWGGPIGCVLLNLLTGKQENTSWIKLLRQEVEAQREEMGPFLDETINTVFQPPEALRVAWSDRALRDERMSTEQIKFLLTSGPLSSRTALDEFGFDADQERTYKAEEAGLLNHPDPEKKMQLLPAFDPAHGKRPGEPGGRPAGTGNAGPRAAAGGSSNG